MKAELQIDVSRKCQCCTRITIRLLPETDEEKARLNRLDKKLNNCKELIIRDFEFKGYPNHGF